MCITKCYNIDQILNISYEQYLPITFNSYRPQNYSDKKNRDGFFVEAGAYDGELISNTLLFELKMGWSGILIEPNPIAFEKLLSKKRKAWSINCCLSMKPYPETVSFDVSGLVGGIVQYGIRPSIYQVYLYLNIPRFIYYAKRYDCNIIILINIFRGKLMRTGDKK